MLPLSVSWTCDGEPVLSSSEGRVLAAVQRGNRPFGKGTVGGGGKKVLEVMMGSRAHTESQCEESRENRPTAAAAARSRTTIGRVLNEEACQGNSSQGK